MNRRFLKIVLWTLAVVVPLVIHFLMKNINTKTLDNLSAFYPFWYAWPCWYVWQSGPFVLLAILCYLRKQNATFRYNSGCLIGAAIGAVIPSIGPYFLLSCPNQGSTANIGVGFFFIFMPFFFALLIFSGWFIGGISWRLLNRVNRAQK